MTKRPLFFVALAFGSGIAIQHLASPPPTFVTLIFGASALLGVWAFTKSANGFVNTTFLLCGCLAAGMLRTMLFEAVPRDGIVRWVDGDSEVVLLGEVRNMPEPYGDRSQVRVFAIALAAVDSASIPVRGDVLAIGDKLDSLRIGDMVFLHGVLELADVARNPGAFDHRLYLKANGIDAIFQVAKEAPVLYRPPARRMSFSRSIANSNLWIQDCLAQFSSGQELALLKGLLIGEREEMEEQVIEDFGRTGLIHILSVSGLHVGFVALILMMATSLGRVPKHWQWAAVIAGLWLYAQITGLQPPVVRASIMASVILLGNTFERKSSLLNSLGLAAIIVLMWQPLQLFQIGFQLSFAAVAGMAYLYRPICGLFAALVPFKYAVLRWTFSLVAVSLAAQSATLPITVASFGRIPVTAIWGNLILIPLSFLAVASGALACMFWPLSQFVAQAYGAVADVSATFMTRFTHWLARTPLAYVEGIKIAPGFLVFCALSIAVLVEWRTRARGWLIVGAVLSLSIHVWSEALSFKPELRATFFDVNQGDAILLELPNHRRLLIDAGPRYEAKSAATRVLLPHFRREGIRRLNAVIITHPHADHLGGLPELLQSIRIDSVYWCGKEIDSELEQRCEALMDSLGICHRVLRKGEQLGAFSPVEVCVLHSGNSRGFDQNTNNASVVVKVLFGKTSLIFPGDAEHWSESQMLRHPEILKSDLLKLGHHGSNTASAPAFLQAVAPHWAVISVGRKNRFGHPSPSVIVSLDSLGIDYVRTDLNGAAVFESDGEEIRRVR